MPNERLWIGMGQHPDLAPWDETYEGLTAFFPTQEAKDCAPPHAVFVTAVASSPMPGSDIRDGYFIAPCSIKKWKWVLWNFTYDDNQEVWSWALRAAAEHPWKDEKEAATELLKAVWTWEKENWETEMFEEIEDTGLLSNKEVLSIGKKIFKK